MDPRSNNTTSGRTRPTPIVPEVSFEEAVLRAKVAQICDHVGYHAITRDSANILVDIYRRTCIHLARHCKEAANNNRRIEPTFVDLIQAYDFIGISIPELKDYIETVKLPFNIKIDEEERKPSNRIQRNLIVDDLLEAEKNTQLEDQDEALDKAMSDSGIEEEEKPPVPLLKEVYQGISLDFPDPSTPIKADKAKIKREEKPAIPKLKITPLDPSIAEPPSFLPILENIKQEQPSSLDLANNAHSTPPPGLLSGSGSKKRTKGLSKTKLKTKSKTKTKTKTTTKTKTKTKLKTKIKTKPITKTKAALPVETSTPTPPPPLPPVSLAPASITIREPTPQPTASPLPPPPVAQVTLKTPTPTPPPPQKSSVKHAKTKKKKKKSTKNEFAIVTESVPAADEAMDYICPGCGGVDDGDWVACDTCESWYHLKCTELEVCPPEDVSWDCSKCATIKREQEEEEREEKEAKRQQQQRQQNQQQSSSSSSSSKVSRKRSQTPVEVPVKTKTPEPVAIKIEAQVLPPLPMGTSLEDLCPECHKEDDGSLMIQCEDPFCAKWFHGKCVNVLIAPENESWFCKACVEKQQSAFQRRRRAK